MVTHSKSRFPAPSSKTGCRKPVLGVCIGYKLQALVYDILPSTTAVFSYAIGSRKLSANEQFFVGAQTVVSLLQTTRIISDVCFITDHVAYASSYKTQIISVETGLFLFFIFLTRGGCASCLRTCLGARLLPQSYQYPNLSEGADRVAGQLRGDKECGVTKSGSVWRKVPESDARCVECPFSGVTKSVRVWRKVPESGALNPHSEHRFPTPSSKLCQI